MSAPIDPLTELEAVNEMLSTISESPVSTLEENQVIEASLALRILRRETAKLQSKGWSFNTDDGFTLQPDNLGELKLPRNTLKVDTSGDDIGTDLTMRGMRLYDRTNHTFKVGRAVVVDLVLTLPFEEMPPVARSYVAARACRLFQDRYAGDEAQHVYTKDDEDDAMAALIEAEIEAVDTNMLSGNPKAQRLIARAY